MAAGRKLLVVGLCLLIVHTHAYDREDYRRAVEIISRLRDSRRGVVDCKALGEECGGIISCCGTTQCYWKNGFNPIKDGVCVKCVDKDLKCQRDKQCCSDLQCNKGNAMWTDGRCEKYRRNGECYRDGQCVKGCVRKWYNTHGTCT